MTDARSEVPGVPLGALPDRQALLELATSEMPVLHCVTSPVAGDRCVKERVFVSASRSALKS